VIILKISKILVMIRFLRFAKWQCIFWFAKWQVIFKNFSVQDWIGFNFIETGPDSN